MLSACVCFRHMSSLNLHNSLEAGILTSVSQMRKRRQRVGSSPVSLLASSRARVGQGKPAPQPMSLIPRGRKIQAKSSLQGKLHPEAQTISPVSTSLPPLTGPRTGFSLCQASPCGSHQPLKVCSTPLCKGRSQKSISLGSWGHMLTSQPLYSLPHLML